MHYLPELGFGDLIIIRRRRRRRRRRIRIVIIIITIIIIKIVRRNRATNKSPNFVVDLLFIVTPIVGFCNCAMCRCALLCVQSSFAIISMGKRELLALLCLSFCCLVIAVALPHDATGLSPVCDCCIS